RHSLSTPFPYTTLFRSVLHAVTGNDGRNLARLVQGSDGALYGTARNTNARGGYGTVFKVTTSGMFTRLYTFAGGSQGGYPGTLRSEEHTSELQSLRHLV